MKERMGIFTAAVYYQFLSLSSSNILFKVFKPLNQFFIGKFYDQIINRCFKLNVHLLCHLIYNDNLYKKLDRSVS